MHVDQMRIDQTPVTIIDFETTGLSARSGDRVVEVGVVRIEPDGKPRVVLDTLVDPHCAVGATSIHGISTEDVVGAPTMSELIGPIAHACVGSLVLAYNASFDMAFLCCEADQDPRLKPFEPPPYACLMYLRPALGIGRRTSLEEAVARAGGSYRGHHAASDALACAAVWARVRDGALDAGHRHWHDVARLRDFKFWQSWRAPVLDQSMADLIGRPDHPTAAKQRPDTESLVPRGRSLQTTEHRRSRYRAALNDAFADGLLSDEDTAALAALAGTAGLNRGEIRAVHAAFFADLLRERIADGFLSHTENDRLQDAVAALRQLGWAPGDESEPTA